MPADLVIGIDSSTTATKAIAWDRRGRAVAEGRAAQPLANPRSGWFEQEVGAWYKSLSAALRQLTRKLDARRIAAVAIANQRETFAQFDARNRPLRPATVWLDERARDQEHRLAATLGADEIHRISGKPSDVIPCITRCLWFAENMPALWKKTAVTADVHGVLVHFLTGRWTTSTASADPMGLLDMAALDWSDTLLSAVKLNRRQLPALVRPGTVVGEITPAAAKLTGLRAGTPVVAGGGDGQSAGTGTNVFAKGRAYVNLGTALVSGSYGEPYAHHPAFRTLSAVAEKGYIYESCLRSGTFLVNWMAEQMFGARPGKAGPLLDQLTREAARSPIGAKGLVLIPYWSGCMSPYWDSHARGLIAGFTGSHRRGDVFRAVIEGLSLEAVMVADQIAAATEPIDHFVAIGGGARSDLWCQILADVGGRPVARLTTVEASALGAGCAAAKGAGWFATIPQAAAAMAGKPARTFRPKAAAAARYRELAKLQAELWPLLSGWNRRLADFAARNAE